METTILAQSYRGSGRPNQIRVVDADNQDEIDRLVEGHQFHVVETVQGYQSEDWAWNQYTTVDADGYTQWK